VLFNHQAERQSFIIAATGSVVWFVTSPRSVERGVLLALALIGVPTVPYLVLWLVIQTELIRAAPAPAATPSVVDDRERRPQDVRWRWSGRYRAAS
jgi:hypothetical protein